MNSSKKDSNAQWYRNGNSYYPQNIEGLEEKIPLAVWSVANGRSGLYLSHQADSFTFPNKIYNLEQEFIDIVLKTWEHTPKNLGVLCSGIKGTGKTFTLKMIAAKTGLPVLLVPASYAGLTSFLEESVRQDVVIFIDEFEKLYSSKDDDDYDEDSGSIVSLLSNLDGTSVNPYRRLFLFSANSTRIDSNLLNRPGRILFHKVFDDLAKSTTLEVINDLLVHKHHQNDVVQTLGELEVLTIDTVRHLVNQVNIHDLPASSLLPYLNLERKVCKYAISIQPVLKDTVGSPVLLGTFNLNNISHKEREINEYCLRDSFRLDRLYIGDIIEVDYEYPKSSYKGGYRILLAADLNSHMIGDGFYELISLGDSFFESLPKHEDSDRYKTRFKFWLTAQPTYESIFAYM